MGSYDPHGITTLDPRGMVGRVYVEHWVLQHAKYMYKLRASGLKRRYFKFSYKFMEDKEHTGRVNLSPGVWLAGFMLGTTRHCYIQNI